MKLLLLSILILLYNCSPKPQIEIDEDGKVYTHTKRRFTTGGYGECKGNPTPLQKERRIKYNDSMRKAGYKGPLIQP